MAYTTSEIGLLARLYPDDARARILGAFRRGGTYEAAATALECSRRHLHRLVVELERIGIERCSPNDLRHGMATRHVEATGNLVGVGYLLGHKKVTTTAIYVHPSRRAAEDVARHAADLEAWSELAARPLRCMAHEDCAQHETLGMACAADTAAKEAT